jgi:hypothetical protein
MNTKVVVRDMSHSHDSHEQCIILWKDGDGNDKKGEGGCISWPEQKGRS